MITLSVVGVPLRVDRQLLLRQTAALTRVIGSPTVAPPPRDLTLLDGLRDLLHTILDATEPSPPPPQEPPATPGPPPSSTKCGRCREPLPSDRPGTPAMTLLCDDCVQVIQRFWLLP